MKLWRAAAVSAVAVVAAYVVGHLVPGHRATIVAIAVLLLFAGGLLTLTGSLVGMRERRSRFDRLLDEPVQAPGQPRDLLRLERSAGWSVYSIVDFDLRVRPVLDRIIRHRLHEHRHVDVEASPDEARRILGDRLGWIVDGERPPVERLVRSSDIERFVTEIEAL